MVGQHVSCSSHVLRLWIHATDDNHSSSAGFGSIKTQPSWKTPLGMQVSYMLEGLEEEAIIPSRMWIPNEAVKTARDLKDLTIQHLDQPSCRFNAGILQQHPKMRLRDFLRSARCVSEEHHVKSTTAQEVLHAEV